MAVAKKHHQLYEELGSIVGSKYVSDDLTVLLSYTRDMSPMPPGKPQGVVARPGSVEEVVELVRLANQTCTPLIPMGGKCSLSGVPPGQPGRGILVDMRRMDKVIEIDEANMAVTAQCGITLGELAGKLHERGFDIHTAEMPHYPDTVGGQLSGYPGAGFGSYGFSIGFNWHYLLGLKVVLPNGSVVDTGTGEGGISTYQGHTFARAMHGPDLTGMFLSDGGIFGIKVEATYRMFYPPKLQKGGALCWDNADEAYQALCELVKIDPYLYMQPYAKAVLNTPEFSEMVGAKPVWLLFWLCIGNSEEEIELKVKTTEAILDKQGGRALEPALAAHIDGFMGQMKDIGKLATLGQAPYFELTVCQRDLLEACLWAREFIPNTLREKGIDRTRVKILGCLFPTGAGQGITSYPVFYDQNDRELERAIHESFVEFFEQARQRGYVIDAPQGHESRVRAKQWTGEFYNYVSGLKKYLDPNNIMNPGVYFL